MDFWTSIWPNPYPEGKVHKRLVSLISLIVDKTTTMETIWTIVEECGVEDDMDKLATSRAIWAIRDEMRQAA